MELHYNQVGDSCSETEDLPVIWSVFKVTQKVLDEGAILAGHDHSGGGLIVDRDVGADFPDGNNAARLLSFSQQGGCTCG